MKNNDQYIAEIHRVMKDYAESDTVFELIARGSHPDISRSPYEKAAQKFMGSFRCLGDYDMVDRKTGAVAFTFLRAFLSQDGRISGAFFYHPDIGGVYDLDTEFDDGTFVVTTTAPSTKLLIPPFALNRVALKPKVPFPILLGLHNARVFKHGVFRKRDVRKKTDSREVFEAQCRQEALKKASVIANQGMSAAQLRSWMKEIEGDLLPEDQAAILEKWKA